MAARVQPAPSPTATDDPSNGITGAATTIIAAAVVTLKSPPSTPSPPAPPASRLFSPVADPSPSQHKARRDHCASTTHSQPPFNSRQGAEVCVHTSNPDRSSPFAFAVWLRPSLFLNPLRRLARAICALLVALLLLLGQSSRQILRCRVTCTLRFGDLPTLALVYLLLAEAIRLGTPKRYGTCVRLMSRWLWRPFWCELCCKLVFDPRVYIFYRSFPHGA